MSLLCLSDRDVRELLSVDACRSAVAEALADYSAGRVTQPPRTFLDTGAQNRLGVMPVALANGVSGLKAMTLFPSNPGLGRPSHQGVIVLFAARHGEPMALIEAGSVTELRTAAASAVATELLSLPDASNLALIGAGAQAFSHLEALLAVRPIRDVWLWNRTPDRLEPLAERARQLGLRAHVVATPEEAVRSARIVCTLTASVEPLIQGQWLEPGTHVNAVGSYQPHTRELDTETILRSDIWVDSRAAALLEAGDIVMPIKEGRLRAESLRGELGELVAAPQNGRSSATQITLFKSLGMAVEDVAAGLRILELAKASGRGSEASLQELEHLP